LPPFHIVVMALTEGIAELLPIGSSAHSVLFSAVSGWPEQSLALDLAVHLGLLAALLAYLWRDLLQLGEGLVDLVRGKDEVAARQVPPLLVAALPALVLGWAIQRFAPVDFGGVAMVAWTSMGFAVLFLVADRFALTVQRIEHLSLSQAFFIGLAQLLGLAPGIGRLGAVILAARLFACERREAARIALLLSVPALACASILDGLGLADAPGATSIVDLLWAGGIAALAGFLSIAFLMRWLERGKFGIFVAYRLLVGGALLYLLYFRGA
jgi:undecaprenyl-diphosphatase